MADSQANLNLINEVREGIAKLRSAGRFIPASVIQSKLNALLPWALKRPESTTDQLRAMRDETQTWMKKQPLPDNVIELPPRE